MRTICSFCDTVIRPGEPSDPVSHGICQTCYRQIMTDHGFDARKFLDLLDAPAANSLALAIAKRPVERIRGKICGKVLDCIHALFTKDAERPRSAPTAPSGIR
jgi:hypothetical protein